MQNFKIRRWWETVTVATASCVRAYENLDLYSSPVLAACTYKAYKIDDTRCFSLFFTVSWARYDDVESSRIRHHSESDRMSAKLFAIQLIESFSRSTVFIGHNTWPKTN